MTRKPALSKSLVHARRNGPYCAGYAHPLDCDGVFLLDHLKVSIGLALLAFLAGLVLPRRPSGLVPAIQGAFDIVLQSVGAYPESRIQRSFHDSLVLDLNLFEALLRPSVHSKKMSWLKGRPKYSSILCM